MYVNARYDSGEDIVHVAERTQDGKRVFKEYKPDHSFYIEDPKGSHTSIFGDTVQKITPNNKKDKNKLLGLHSQRKTFETDIDPINRCLEQEYSRLDPARLQVAFFDIEVDFDKTRGYSSPQEAFNPITSIAVYLQWLESMVCFAVPPKGMSRSEAEAIADQVGNCIIVDNEAEMLKMFAATIEDADLISGWNSEFFDVPYVINRTIQVLGKHETRKYCFWNELPKKKTVNRNDQDVEIWSLVGRIHMDYLDLYKKYTYEERHSYALNAIAEYELNEKKVEYDGTLDELYNNDFKKFLEYNIQDTMLLEKLDKKLQYIDLANNIAHGANVLLPATLGAVAVTESAIIAEAHRRGMVVMNKNRSKQETRAAGGWVQKPKIGLHKWIGSVDLNSLYPSVIRALNMSPETIVGQINTDITNYTIDEYINKAAKNSFAGWWNDRFNILEMEPVLANDRATTVLVEFESGEKAEVSGAELRKAVFSQPWCISANGTIFRTDIDGVIPGLLTTWYSDRKSMKKVLWNLVQLRTGLIETQYDGDITVPDALPNLKKLGYKDLANFIDLNKPETYDQFAARASEFGLEVRDGKLWVREQFVQEWKEAEEYWDKRQLVRKINLNSLYGGLLNEHCRFFDQRLGQSTTLTGRSITRHMAAKANELFTGEYNETGQSVIYGDTDSVYFSAYPVFKDQIESGEIKWNKEKVIELYDRVGDMINETFPDFMADTFNVPRERSTGVIAAGREIVATTGLFIKKKRYAAMVYDSEGERKDVNGKPGKMKAMGLDLRRADTPKFVQEFLSKTLEMVLTGHTQEQCIEYIKQFKEQFSNMNPWEKGAPKGVNGLFKYIRKIEERTEAVSRRRAPPKLSIPGHIQASINWNQMCDRYNDLHRVRITDGSKVIVCYLKQNDFNFTSIAYPVNETHLPEWFTSLPFDETVMLEKGVDQKVENMIGVLKWDLSKTNKQSEHFESFFSFD